MTLLGTIALSVWFGGTAIARFSTGQSSGGTVNAAGDGDHDGLTDNYELAHPCLNPGVADGDDDSDFDGLTNLEESYAGTLPCVADTDGDGYNDGTEVSLAENPLTYCAVMRADINGDVRVNSLDLFFVANKFGPFRDGAREDQNADTNVNSLDLFLVARVFGLASTACP